MNDPSSYPVIDYYTRFRNDRLKSLFPSFPNIEIKLFIISFSINRTTKANDLFQILDKFDDKNKTIIENQVALQIYSLQELFKYRYLIRALYTIVGYWKSLDAVYNDVHLIRENVIYLLSYIGDIADPSVPVVSPTSISSNRKREAEKKTATGLPPADLSAFSPLEAFKYVFNAYFESYLQKYEVRIVEYSSTEIVIDVENDLVVCFRLSDQSIGQILSGKPKEATRFLFIIIQELSYNNLFVFNLAAFRRSFLRGSILIEFLKFRGINSYNKAIDSFYRINSKWPSLKLIDRYEKFPGELFHFIVFSISDEGGNTEYAIGYTKKAPHKYVLKVCFELEEKNSRSLLNNGSSTLESSTSHEFIKAFLSWSGKKKRWRLENQLTYICIDRFIKEEVDIFPTEMEVLNNAKNGKYSTLEHGTYLKPINRWKTEELVYNIIKELFGSYRVIYQYRPYYLKTNSGALSYDIYICGLKVAVEYQGKQHFEPVEYFGGKENFEKQAERDRIKQKLSAENGIKLVYINYWDSITPDNIKRIIDERMARED